MAQPSTTEYDPSTYWTAPARNFRSSARLHLQHYLIQRTLGYLLEKSVQDFATSTSQGDSGPPLRVADLGCGNGAWLCDLHDEFSNAGVTVQLDGYDINPINFPAAAFLPSAVTLKKLDILKQPLPEDVAGLYDIVHVRAFGSILVDIGPAPLLSVVLAMLKPGGYLQWEELRGDKFQVTAPSADTPSDASTTISQMLQAAGKARGSDFSYLDKLGQKVKDFGGFDNVHAVAFEKRTQDYKGWTEDILMIWEELAVHFPRKADALTAAVTRESYLDLFQRAVAETELGVAIHQGKIMTVVGRKAM
ncbi:hypothetical protein PG995_007330 [Apiospora arundinis]